ncbi:unnamed protein product, partial [Amoebophrya sp. A120]
FVVSYIREVNRLRRGDRPQRAGPDCPSSLRRKSKTDETTSTNKSTGFTITITYSSSSWCVGRVVRPGLSVGLPLPLPIQAALVYRITITYSSSSCLPIPIRCSL